MTTDLPHAMIKLKTDRKQANIYEGKRYKFCLKLWIE